MLKTFVSIEFSNDHLNYPLIKRDLQRSFISHLCTQKNSHFPFAARLFALGDKRDPLHSARWDYLNTKNDLYLPAHLLFEWAIPNWMAKIPSPQRQK